MVVRRKLVLGGNPLNIYVVGICTRPRLWSPELLAAVSFHLNIGDSGAGHVVPFKQEDVKSQARLKRKQSHDDDGGLPAFLENGSCAFSSERQRRSSEVVCKVEETHEEG